MQVSRDQVHAWRLRRQFVDPRTDADAVDVVSRLCGVQAQVSSAAELAVKLRQSSPDEDAIERGLAGGTLIKTWAMRGTLHVLRPSEAAACLALIASARTWEKGAWQRVTGTTPAQIQALVEAVSELLDGACLTRDELVSKLAADKRFAPLEESLRSGWGSMLKPIAWQGALCHGPGKGNRVTFTRPDTAVPDWPGIPDPDEAASVAIAAYLGAYGPATPETFDAWLTRGSVKKSTLRGWFASMGDQLTEVDVEGQAAYLLAEHADDLAGTTPGTSVHLLGPFDQYVLGPGTNDPHLLAPEHRAKVSKAAGWIAPIVVVGGRIAGVWELADEEVQVSLFPGSAKTPQKGLEAAVQEVARAYGRDRLRLQT
jgi:hypothetical protein